MTLSITPLYAGILAFALVALTVAVVRNRARYHVSLGDGAGTPLHRVVRGHGNFAEFVPMGLILMALAELTGAAPMAIHGIGVALLVGRALHAWCFLCTEGNFPVRVAGMLLTMGALVAGGVICLRVGIGI
ncbi:MAG: MAPEG family protein [Rhodospirillaceae bacterium]